MNTMIVTNDSLTTTRMRTIAHRTHSTLIAGAKAMMIAGLKNQMRYGVAHFAYPKYTNGCGISREHYCTTAYFDVEKSGWRSFRWENIIAVY